MDYKSTADQSSNHKCRILSAIRDYHRGRKKRERRLRKSYPRVNKKSGGLSDE